jgi:hypothetical protein
LALVRTEGFPKGAVVFPEIARSPALALTYDSILIRRLAGESLVHIIQHAYFAELQDHNSDLGELADRPYRMQDFPVTGTSGNRLVFGEPIVE